MGFSTSSADSEAGVLVFNKMCQETFPSSRMCKSEEGMKVINIPDSNGRGWVKPAIQSRIDTFFIDASGLHVNQDGTCLGWSSNSSRNGLIVYSSGSFFSSIIVAIPL